MYYTIFAVSLTNKLANGNNKEGQLFRAILHISNCKVKRSFLFFQIF